MTLKKFLFWSGIGIVVVVASYLIIQFFKSIMDSNMAKQLTIEAKRIAAAPRREVGFHAIAKDHAALSA